MEPSAAQLRALLFLVGIGALVVLAVVVRLVRSGRAVQFPDVSGGEPPSRAGRGDHVSIP